ncbi:reverse transcriptase domain-containing protein [Tanacetum coccineum]
MAKKERVKSIALKAKKQSSDDETLTSGSDDEEYAMAVRNFKKCGDPNHLIGDCPKPSRNKDQRAFIGGSWSDSKNDAEDKTNDETCLMAQSSNEVTLNSSYYSDNVSSLDLLEKEVLELNEKIKKLERSKEIDITYKLCQELKLENAILKETQVKFVKFDKSANSLREMLNNQKPSSCKIGLGFDSSKASTSRTKPVSFVGSSAENATDGSTIKVHGSTIPGSMNRTVAEKVAEHVQDLFSKGSNKWYQSLVALDLGSTRIFANPNSIKTGLVIYNVPTSFDRCWSVLDSWLIFWIHEDDSRWLNLNHLGFAKRLYEGYPWINGVYIFDLDVNDVLDATVRVSQNPIYKVMFVMEMEYEEQEVYFSGMPNYGKFLKELVSNKHKIEQISFAFFSDESSAMIQNKVSPKLGDPKSFLIPCTFGKTFSCNALADLGASINLMPYSLYTKLSLETLKPTKMSVRLADRSFQYPIGIAENMLVEVGKFTFLVDFVILEIEEDSKVPLILGRPFLHTAGAVIRVKQKQLNLGVGTKRVIFHIDSTMKHSYSNDDTCFSIDVIDKILEEDFDALLDEGTKILYSIGGTPH